MNITATELSAEIKEVEGIGVVVLRSKPGELFPSYKAKWPRGLADTRTAGAFKRRLEYCLRGYGYGILGADNQKIPAPSNVFLGTIRGNPVSA